jgi:hypothetical protein
LARAIKQRVLTLVLVALLGVGVSASMARADGDPASDILLQIDVFYPYDPPVSQHLQGVLNAETAAAHRAHFPIKVALIATQMDLGAVPNLFGKPQSYADFLDQEIRFITGRDPLLVVMPSGYGVKWIAAPAAAGLPEPSGRQSDDLARAAIADVRKLAAATGHPIKAVPDTVRGGSANHDAEPAAAILAVAAVALAGTITIVRRRRPRIQ